MKISFIQLILAVSFAGFCYAHDAKAQGILETPISVRLEAKSIKTILSRLEKEAKVKFMYSAEVIKADRITSLYAKNQSLGEVLGTFLSPLNISFRTTNNGIALTSKAVELGLIQGVQSTKTELKIASDITIKGTVTDEKGEKLLGVKIALKGTNRGIISDVNGEFSIDVPSDNAVLVFSFVGFLGQEVQVGNRTQINVILVQDSKSLEEVVVVGYGTVKKSDLTGSVSSVSSERITQVKGVANIAQTLQGQAAGVQVNQSSGQPGEGSIIQIRGVNSIGASNAPLYVVDGLPLDGLTGQLNPGDIANIEVLKDASSTAIYGSRGANGVVLITTKKGAEGKPQVTLNTYYSVQSLRKKIDLVNASDFATLQNEVATNDGTALPWTNQQISEWGSKGTDWQDLAYKNAPTQNYDLSVSGGNKTTKYYTSFGYYDQKGIIENTRFKRYSFRANVSQELNSKLSLGTSLSLQNSTYTNVINNNADYGGVPFQTMVMPPTQGVYDASGNYTIFTGVQWGQTNPVGMAKGVMNPSNNFRLIGNTALTYKILDGLTWKSSAGLDNSWNRADSYIDPSVTFGQPGGVASLTYSNSSTFITEHTLSYLKNINKTHFFDIVGGITYQSSIAKSLSSGTASGFASTVFQNNNLQAATNRNYPSTSYSDRSLLSYLGRINYNLKNKYYLTITGRYDGSSVFGDDNKYAFFPSGAFAWKVIDEPFMKGISSVSNLKLRASYGTSGNQAINPYQSLASVRSVSSILDNQLVTAYLLGSLDNKGLKWETTTQADLGFDLGLFNNRIQITADFYQKKTSDLLLFVTLPPSSGFGSVLQNVGAVENKGVEFQLTSVNTVGALKWNTTLTLSHNQNKVLSLGNDALGNPITYKEVGTGGNWFPMIVGSAMSQLYGQTVSGVYQSKEEAVKNGEPQKDAGDYKFLDYNNDGKVDENDKHVLTHMQPKLTFGFNNTFKYQNFDLSLLFVGALGNDIVNEFRKYNLTLNGLWTPTKEAFNNRWTSSNPSATADKPSVKSMQYTRDYANSLWVEKGAYLRLRDITLGYTISTAKIKNVRIYASAQNYLTFTKYSGYDPEVAWGSASVNGWDRGVYPSMKAVLFGANLNF